MRSCLGRIARFVSARKVADGDMGCTGGGCVGRRSADMVRVSVDLRQKQQKAAATQPTEQDQVRLMLFRTRKRRRRTTHASTDNQHGALPGWVSTCRQARRGGLLAAGQEGWRAKKCHVVQKMAYERARTLRVGRA